MNSKCMEESGFNFEGWGKAGIQEFGYLVRMLSNDKYDRISEETIRGIAEDSELLINEIEIELAKDILTEQDRLNISKETAIHNLNNLKEIIISIKKYINCIDRCHNKTLEKSKWKVWVFKLLGIK